MQGSHRENDQGDPCRCEATASSNPPTERTLQDYDKTKSKSKTKQVKSRLKGMSRKWKENQRKWKHEWNQERLELERILKVDLNKDQ